MYDDDVHSEPFYGVHTQSFDFMVAIHWSLLLLIRPLVISSHTFDRLQTGTEKQTLAKLLIVILSPPPADIEPPSLHHAMMMILGCQLRYLLGPDEVVAFPLLARDREFGE